MFTAENCLHRMYEAPFLMKDPGASGTIYPRKDRSMVPVVTTTAQARTLAQPYKAGLICTVVLDTDGGDLTLTVTGGYNADSATSITFGDAADFVTFISIKVGTSYYWRVLAQEGTNVAMEDITVDQLTATTAGLTTATITTLNAETIAFAAETAEHGAGAIGTGAAPKTYRYTVNGEIITDIKVDLQGLASKNTANDVIGLAAGGVAKLGQYTVAIFGVVYRVELICLETPATGDNDVNVVLNASGTLEYDGAGGAGYGVDGGDAVAGQVVEDLVQGLTDTHYIYLTAGTGDTAQAYTAGQFIIRFHGHPILT